MNAPIDRIYAIRDGQQDDDLNEELSDILYNDKNQGLSPIMMMGNSAYVAGFRACEKEYQRLWQDFIDSHDDKSKKENYATDYKITNSVFCRFQKWLEGRQLKKDIDNSGETKDNKE